MIAMQTEEEAERRRTPKKKRRQGVDAGARGAQAAGRERATSASQEI